MPIEYPREIKDKVIKNHMEYITSIQIDFHYRYKVAKLCCYISHYNIEKVINENIQEGLQLELTSVCRQSNCEPFIKYIF
mmetsp:Transcript_9126/g.4857  ORF Transcript_9126/g.4857 Transcript_9126/m.4857 type:complete len:80 (-) Transcript_9126:224-463(-)